MSKRSNGEGTISKRSSDGLWIGQISLGYDEFGKAVRKACSAKTQAECKKKLDKLKKQFAFVQNKSVDKKSYVDYLLADWVNEKKFVEQLEESTIQTHISRINCYFKNFFQDIELQKIDSKLLSDFYAHLNLKNLSAETVHKIHAIVNNSFKLAVRNGLVSSNPATGIKLPKKLPKVHSEGKKFSL